MCELMTSVLSMDVRLIIIFRAAVCHSSYNFISMGKKMAVSQSVKFARVSGDSEERPQ